jgi:hypothetical protein
MAPYNPIPRFCHKILPFDYTVRESHVAISQYVQCGGAGRGSVALTGTPGVVTVNAPAPASSHEVALGLWSKLWTPFERLAEIANPDTAYPRNKKCCLPEVTVDRD